MWKHGNISRHWQLFNLWSIMTDLPDDDILSLINMWLHIYIRSDSMIANLLFIYIYISLYCISMQSS